MNINEKFLLELLANTEDISCDKSDYEGFSFHPYGLNMEVKIPYDNGSEKININLIYSVKNKNGQSFKKTINFAMDSISEINEFLPELYRKYEKSLNLANSQITQDILDKFENMLKLPVDKNYPYNSKIDYYQPRLEEKIGNKEYSMEIYGSVFEYTHKNKLKTLSPIVIPCSYCDGNEGAFFKKVIPAYLIKDYPILHKHIKPDPIVNNIHDLNKILNSLRLNNPKSEAILNALILEDELSSSNSEKKPKHKL